MSCSNPEEWDDCIKVLRETKKLSEVDYKNFDGVYFPGGHGPMFDLAENKEVAEIVEYFFRSGKLVSAVCHGPAANYAGLDTQLKMLLLTQISSKASVLPALLTKKKVLLNFKSLFLFFLKPVLLIWAQNL